MVKATAYLTDEEFMTAVRAMVDLPPATAAPAIEAMVMARRGNARAEKAMADSRARAAASRVARAAAAAAISRAAQAVAAVRKIPHGTVRAEHSAPCGTDLQVTAPPLELALTTPLPQFGKGVGGSLSSGSDSESVRSGSETGSLSASGSGARVCVERSTQDEAFARFWAAYPRRVGKIDARAAWNRRIPPIDAVLTALEWQRRQPQWLEQGGAFVPHPSVWINRGSWDDEPVAGPRLSAPAARMMSDALKSRSPPAVAPRGADERREAALAARNDERRQAQLGGLDGTDE